MIEGLKPYTTYKDSGQEWLGQIPAHWELKTGHAAYAERHEPNAGLKENTVLSLSYGRIKVKPVEKQHGLVPKSYETYQVVDEGNIIIRGTDMQNDHTSLRVGLSGHRGIISSAYICLQTRRSIIPTYGYQLLNTFDTTKAIYRYGSGLRQNLSYDEIRRLPVFLPPVDEQTAIVRFLDHANRKIDDFIRAKRKLIALLGEQKQTIIHRAVTRGLTPHTPLKASGIPWLGDIPAHWSRSRLKFEASHIVDCLHATPNYQSDGVFPAIRTADIEPGKVRLEQARKISPHEYQRWTSRLRPEQGDILYSREGERFGIAANVPADTQLCISQRMMVFRIRKRQNSEFLMWQLNCQHVYLQASLYVMGSTAPHVNVDQIQNFLLAFPPLDEQRNIVGYVRAESFTVDAAITRTEREISLLREYRTRLTADVVTGKLDVREAAAKLPNLPADAVEPAQPEVENEVLEDSEPDESAD